MLCYKGIVDTILWFQKAKPEPTSKDLSTQLGVHVEEVAESLGAVTITNDDVRTEYNLLLKQMEVVQLLLKQNDCVVIEKGDRLEFLDGLADQMVTTVALAYMSNMNIQGALNEVNRSNFSKFDENGNALLDINRKIIKGPNYTKPDLTQFV